MADVFETVIQLALDFIVHPQPVDATVWKLYLPPEEGTDTLVEAGVTAPVRKFAFRLYFDLTVRLVSLGVLAVRPLQDLKQ